jgi:hypothetical protein
VSAGFVVIRSVVGGNIRSWRDLRSRCHLQHLQRPTPPHFRFNASHFPRRGDQHVAQGSYGCLKSQELQAHRALSSAT